jgi:DNA-binding transcriptional regulator LsrR (DeoR family)
VPLAPDPVRHNQLVDVARLYYLRNLTHEQIARKLGLSRVKVTRLLAQAVRERVVEFRIADPVADTLVLQDRLEERFGLKQAIVAPGSDSESQTLATLGRFAAAWLDERLAADLVIGLGWGRTLNALAPHLAPTRHGGISVVSLTGGLAANSRQPNPYDTVTAVAARLGAQPHYLLLPAIADSEQTRDLLLQEASARAVTALWERTDIAMLSIGLLAPETGVFYSLPDPGAGVGTALGAGGVGDILARPFDADGRFIETEFVARTIAIAPEHLARVPLVAGVAGGPAKAGAILGALRTGLLSVLITDEHAALGILGLAAATGDGR